jgi:hypothetical protein
VYSKSISIRARDFLPSLAAIPSQTFSAFSGGVLGTDTKSLQEDWLLERKGIKEFRR